MLLQLEVIENKIDSAVGLIENEPIIQWCRDGRIVPGFKRPEGFTETPRYPHITDQVRIRVANSLMNVARDNYQNKYNNLMSQMTRDYSELGRRITELDTALTDAARKDMRRETAQRSCLALADMTILPKSPTPPTGNPTKWIIMAIAIAAAIAAIVFTAGAATGAFAAMALTVMTSGGAVSVAGGGAIVAAAVTGTVAVAGAATLIAGESEANSKEIKTHSGDYVEELPLTHTAKLEQWNYRDTVTVTFDPNSFICTKCTVTQECAKEDNPVFGDRGCKKWRDETPEKCEEIQL